MQRAFAFIITSCVILGVTPSFQNTVTVVSEEEVYADSVGSQDDSTTSSLVDTNLENSVKEEAMHEDEFHSTAPPSNYSAEDAGDEDFMTSHPSLTDIIQEESFLKDVTEEFDVTTTISPEKSSVGTDKSYSKKQCNKTNQFVPEFLKKTQEIETDKEPDKSQDKNLTEVETLQAKISEQEKLVKALQDRINDIEEETKTNNVVFFNIPEKKSETYKNRLDKVLRIINRAMKVKVNANEIAVAAREGPRDNNSTSQTHHSQHRPLVVRFTNFATKLRVMGASGRLASPRSRFTPATGPVSLAADYSTRVRRVRAQLLPHLEAARARGSRTFLVYDRLVIDGVIYTLRELEAGAATAAGVASSTSSTCT